MYNSGAFRTCTKWHSRHHGQLQNILIPPKATPYSLAVPRPSQPLASTSVPSVSGCACSGHFLSVESYTVGLCVWPLFPQCRLKVHSCCVYHCFLSSFKDLSIFCFLFIFILYFVCLSLTVPGLHCFVWASSAAVRGSCRLVGLLRLLLPRRAGCSSCGPQAPEHRLGSCVHRRRFPAACGTFAAKDGARVPHRYRQILHH